MTRMLRPGLASTRASSNPNDGQRFFSLLPVGVCLGGEREDISMVNLDGDRSSVNGGLRALAEGSTSIARQQWRLLIETEIRDPEPYLFHSMLSRVSRDFGAYPEAVGFAERACALDP